MTTKKKPDTATESVAVEKPEQQVKDLTAELAEANKANQALQKQVEELQIQLEQQKKAYEALSGLAKEGFKLRDNTITEQKAELEKLRSNNEGVEVTDNVTVTLHRHHPHEQYMRCGMVFTKEPTTLSIEECGEELIAQLVEDKCLEVTFEGK